MVDNKIAGNLRINAARIATQSSARLAHRGEVNEHGHTGKVLEQHARGHELNFFARATRQTSLNNALGKARGLLFVLHVAQNVFNKNLQRQRQTLGALNSIHRVERIALPCNRKFLLE